MTVTNFDPEKWLETCVRGVKDFAEEAFDLDVYEVVMEFPGAELDSREAPWKKTVVHFNIDAQDDGLLGMGDSPLEWNYSAPEHAVFPQWGAFHVINFDVGIWATDKSGGPTSRMRAKQHLWNLFGGPTGIINLRAATDGGDGAVEIVNFTGGHNTIDSTTNDVRVYRTVDCSLEVRVFSRTPLPVEAGPAIEEITQTPGLTIIG